MKTFKKWLGCAVLAATLVLFAGCGPTRHNNYEVALTLAEAPAETPSAAAMLEKIRPSVVDVTSYGTSSASAGSGVIISSAGEGADRQYFIVTNHHVIDGGTQFVVDVLSIAEDGSETTTAYEAYLVGSSFGRDIAVLSVRPPVGTEFSTATFIADSDKVKVGTEVFAIGNPLGILGGTVTHGIVSATKRSVSVGEIGTMTLMQTDTSINGGNSGGGLFDANGILVGIINSGYDTYNGQNVEGLNFAIPANDARYAAEQLIETHVEDDGKVTTYGYVEGDSRLDIVYDTAALYAGSSGGTRRNYLVAQASSTSSPLYTAWQSAVKAISYVSVNGEQTTFDGNTGSAYTLTAKADTVFTSLKAGDTVVIGYYDIGTGGSFMSTYNYVIQTLHTVQFTAQQYIYTPPSA